MSRQFCHYICFLITTAVLTGCNEDSAENQSPTASLYYSVETNGLTVSFSDKNAVTDKGIHDPDGYLTKLEIAYGDGNSYVTNSPTSGFTLSHTYKLSGSYDALITLWDNSGAQTSLRLPLTVVAHRKLNDTGVSFCANDVGYLPDCTASSLGTWADLTQDGLTGRDADFRSGSLVKAGSGPDGFDYTKVSTGGLSLSPDATTWACVRDNHTGLMWELKRADGGLRDWRHRYTWYDNDNSRNGGHAGYQDAAEIRSGVTAGSSCGNTMEKCNTSAFVNKVNALSLCTFSDWRLPSLEELRTLPHHNRINPAIDNGFFPRTAHVCNGESCGDYWTSTSFASTATSEAWFTSFSSGYSNHSYKYDRHHVRLVRDAN